MPSLIRYGKTTTPPIAYLLEELTENSVTNPLCDLTGVTNVDPETYYSLPLLPGIELTTEEEYNTYIDDIIAAIDNID